MALGRQHVKNLKTKFNVIVKIAYDGMQYHGKTHLYYNQNTWLKQIDRKSGRKIGIRQLCYDFAGGRALGFIRTYKRWEYDPETGTKFRSSVLYIAEVGWKMLAYYKICTRDMACKMIHAIKKGGQAAINKVQEWITPDYYKEYLSEYHELCPEPDG